MDAVPAAIAPLEEFAEQPPAAYDGLVEAASDELLDLDPGASSKQPGCALPSDRLLRLARIFRDSALSDSACSMDSSDAG